MKIIQITDLHIGLPAENTFDTDVRGNFRRVLDRVREVPADHLVVSGDLCFRDGDPAIYAWIKEQLDAQPAPYEVISGNHDDPGLMSEIFGRNELLRGDELYFCREIAGHPVLFLDTTTGSLSDRQLRWLEKELRQYDREQIIFMHHPPLLSGVPYMDDRYALENRAEVQSRLFGHPHRVHVFCGHYHVERTVQQQNVTVYLTPSCFFQIDYHHEEFRVDHRRPAFREIVVEEGVLMSTVVYV